MSLLTICSAEDMTAAVHRYGIIPFFKCGVPGWSIEELTPPEHWFFSSDELGPWDWKIDVVREGDIAYGKFLGGKAAFATVGWYAHLMNWRRNQARYAPAPDSPAATALSFIRKNGAASSTEIRVALSEASGAPVKKSICDATAQFLDMGTWTVTGDLTRVYRGPNAEYTGWQRSSRTTPEAMFGGEEGPSSNATQPYWARFIDPDASSGTNPLETGCKPEQSLETLLMHVREFFPDAEDKKLRKILL